MCECLAFLCAKPWLCSDYSKLLFVFLWKFSFLFWTLDQFDCRWAACHFWDNASPLFWNCRKSTTHVVFNRHLRKHEQNCWIASSTVFIVTAPSLTFSNSLLHLCIMIHRAAAVCCPCCSCNQKPICLRFVQSSCWSCLMW